MAYDEFLADRIRHLLREKKAGFAEKYMMGGIAFMVDEKMCLGVVKDELMARVGPAAGVDALKKPGCRPMDFTGRPMKGYVFVSPEGLDLEQDLEYFIELSLAFNPLAEKAKKKAKKA